MNSINDTDNMNRMVHASSILSILSMLSILVLTSCQTQHLSVHSDYVGKENLASYFVETPDPLLDNPPVGQRLIVSWSLPADYSRYRELYLLLTIRYGNRQEEQVKLLLRKLTGTYVYQLLQDDYFNRCGITTYKVDLYSDEQLLDCWRHQLWCDLLILNDQESK